jgi:hypothetical protein
MIVASEHFGRYPPDEVLMVIRWTRVWRGGELSTLPPPDPRTRLDGSPFVQSHRRVLIGPAVITVASLIGVGLMNDVVPTSSAHRFSLVPHSTPAAPSARTRLASAPIVRTGGSESALPAAAAVVVPALDTDGIRATPDRATTTTTAPVTSTTLAASVIPASSAAKSATATGGKAAPTTATTKVPVPTTAKPVVTNNPTTVPSSPPATGYGVSYITAGPGGTCNDPSYPVKAAHQAYYLPGTQGYSAAPATQCFRSAGAATQAGLYQSTYDPPKPTT